MTPATGQSAEFEFGSWSTPQLAVTIEYPLEVMDEIRAFACDELQQLSHGGREVGGIMFGSRRERSIRILTWRPMVCEYAEGDSLHLSPADCLALAVQLERARVDLNLRDLRPVGWFVSHPRSGVFLSPSNLETYQGFFPESWQIALVLHPTGTGNALAGFFLREPDGSVKSEASYRDFSLEPLHLSPGVSHSASVEPAETVAPLARAELPNVAQPAPPLPTPSFQIAEPIPSKERWLWAIPIGLALLLAVLLLYHWQAPAANPPRSTAAVSHGPAAQPEPVRDPNPAPPAQPADSSEVIQLRAERDQLAAQVQQRDEELRKERAKSDQLQNLIRILENRLNIDSGREGKQDK
jgi:hypothetical protein